jgi:hypothetical protein
MGGGEKPLATGPKYREAGLETDARAGANKLAGRGAGG